MQIRAPGHLNSNRVLSELGRKMVDSQTLLGTQQLWSQSWKDPEPRAKIRDTATATAITWAFGDFKASPFGPHIYVLHRHVIVREADIGKGNAQGTLLISSEATASRLGLSWW